jgi:ankyrin repeat protein
MPSRELPARPDLDQLKRQAKELQRAFAAGEEEAVGRVDAVLGAKDELKLTEAQLVVAREYGFSGWARLRSRVIAKRDPEAVLDGFVTAVMSGDPSRPSEILASNLWFQWASIHAAAVLGNEDDVRRLLAKDPALVHLKAGNPPSDPLICLCFSPELPRADSRDWGHAGCARALLEAGADPNGRSGAPHGMPALYGVAGLYNAPEVVEALLEAGAEPNDGESVFHAAERFHLETLELLLRHGVDLNLTGDWGNTPLYFLLRYWHLDQAPPTVRKGLLWLLEHGADPNVLCGRERESALHVAARRGQPRETVALLLERGADVHLKRGDGRTAWALAHRGGFDDVTALLEGAGARPEDIGPVDLLLAACGHGDAEAARRLASPRLLESLEVEELRLLPEAAATGRNAVVEACLAAGFPVDTQGEDGASALHHVAIRGEPDLVRALLAHGADFGIRDAEHDSTPLGWAVYGADRAAQRLRDHIGAVRALLEAGARLRPGEESPQSGSVVWELMQFED